ncbi:MAG: DUF3014 domain-containing protein [Lentisphaeria bacterium]|nr:DUF3014 domain-containing protein [Lentisphaeria bacterium]
MAPTTTQKILIVLIPLLVAGILGGLYWRKKHSQPEKKPQWTLVEENAEELPALPDFPDGDEEDGLIQPDETVGDAIPDSKANDPDLSSNGIVHDRIPTESELLEAAGALTGNPLFQQLLSQDSTLKLLVRLLDAVANGEAPVGLLNFVGDFQKFQAGRNAEGYLAATTATTNRFGRFIDAFTSIPPADAAGWYRRAEPKMQEILRAMGYHELTMRQLVTNAFTVILQIPEFSFDPELVPRGAEIFEYQDPIFQGLNDAQKLIVRQGPENCAKVRSFCLAVAKELELFRE